jgi:hypothetical protein
MPYASKATAASSSAAGRPSTSARIGARNRAADCADTTGGRVGSAGPPPGAAGGGVAAIIASIPAGTPCAISR